MPEDKDGLRFGACVWVRPTRECRECDWPAVEWFDGRAGVIAAIDEERGDHRYEVHATDGQPRAAWFAACEMELIPNRAAN